MKTIVSRLFGLALFAAATSLAAVPAAQAGQGNVVYKPGVVKAAVAKGRPALLFYKSTW